MIAPVRCCRMIGSTCLQAMTVPRRLIADQSALNAGTAVWDKWLRKENDHVCDYGYYRSGGRRRRPHAAG